MRAIRLCGNTVGASFSLSLRRVACMGYQTVNTSSKVRSYIELQRDAKLAPSSHQAGMCQLWLTLLLATNIARPTHTLALRLLGWLSSHVYGFFVRRHCDFQR